MANLTLRRDTCVVVADGEKAFFLRNEGDALQPRLKVMFELRVENPPTHAQGSDRPGRFHDGPSPHRSAVDDTDWHRVAKERFAAEVAERLYHMAHRREFGSLVLAASPLVLGEMRKSLHREVVDLIAAEIPKTLTGHPAAEIQKVLLAN